MPAGRYEDWSHVHVVGERGDALPFLPFARKLLGFVFQQASHNNLGVHVLRRDFQDGTIVIAEKHGTIPRITIVPGPRALEEIPLTPPSDFVVWARDAARPAGIDATYPQQILQVRGDAESETALFWKTYFYNDEIPGFEEFAGTKGTYSGQLEEGLRYFGNVDWVGRDGERLSWHGPTLRYWFDGWRQPSFQYGRRLFLLGQVLLDVDDYCTESDVDFNERLILGAARRGLHLYVMHARIDDNASPTFVPVGRGGDVYVTPPYPTAAIALCLRRYQLLVDPDTSKAMRLRVDSESHEVLWQQSHVGAVNPWFFAPDASAAETFCMPAQAMFRRYQDAADAYVYDAPSASSNNLRLAISDEGVTLSTVATALQFNQQSASAPIAVDYDQEGNRIELQLEYEAFGPLPTPQPNGNLTPAKTAWAHRYLAIGELRVPIYRGGPLTYNERWGTVYGIDLRARAFVVVENRQLDANWNFESRLVVHHAGRVEAAELLASKTVVNGGAPVHAAWDQLGADAGLATCSPLAYLFGPMVFGDYDHPFGALTPPQGFYLDRGFGPRSWFLCKRNQAVGVVAIYMPTDGNTIGLLDPLTGYSADYYWNDRADTDGYRVPATLAADGTALIYSGPGGYLDYDTGGLRGAHYATDSDLRTLTGVEGTDPRFHPVWRLGKQPRLA